MPLTTPSGQPLAMQPGEFVPTPGANEVGIGLQQVAPPSVLYIQRDDVIAMVAKSQSATETVTITGRFLRAHDGVIVPFSQTFRLTPANTIVLNSLALGEGYLLGIAAIPSQANFRGQTYCALMLGRGRFTNTPLVGTSEMLCAGYITGNAPIGWPGGPMQHWFDGNGFSGSQTAGNPTAGTDISFTFSTTAIRRINLISATLTTSATVANRQVVFTIDGEFLFRVAAIANITATQSRRFLLGVGIPNFQDVIGHQYLPLPAQGVSNSSGSVASLATNTTGLDATDQWSAISIGFEEWQVVS